MHENDDGNWTSGELPLCLDRCPNGLEKYVHGGIMSFGEDEQGKMNEKNTEEIIRARET